jgi:hypothetical protein
MKISAASEGAALEEIDQDLVGHRGHDEGLSSSLRISGPGVSAHLAGQSAAGSLERLAALELLKINHKIPANLLKDSRDISHDVLRCRRCLTNWSMVVFDMSDHVSLFGSRQCFERIASKSIMELREVNE